MRVQTILGGGGILKIASLRVKGTNISLSFGDIALNRIVPHICTRIKTLTLNFISSMILPILLIRFGCHMRLLTVDKETGKVQLKRFCGSSDVVNVMYPNDRGKSRYSGGRWCRHWPALFKVQI
jgi:hypothetical protein